MSDGDSLDATYFVPSQQPPANGYPAILFVHGFGLTKDVTAPSCSLYAAGGYTALTYSVRGHGNSSGLSTIMSMRERKDFGEALTFLRELPNIDTTAIGISGGSQGGLHGLWTAADQLPIQAITADVIVPAWASDMLANGSVRRTTLLLLQSAGVRYEPIRDTLWDFVRTDSYDSLLARFPVNRDVDTAKVNTSRIPMLLLLKWQDHYFAAQNGIEEFSHYHGTKKIYIGTRGHFSDQAESERVYQYDQLTRWLNQFLKRESTGILDEPVYTYAYSSLPMDSLGYFMWTRVGVPTWPPAGVSPVRFYLSLSDSSLLRQPPAGNDPDSIVLPNDYRNPSYTFDTAYIEGFRGSRFDAILPKVTRSFTSVQLDEDVWWIGVPTMALHVRSSFEKFPLHVQVYGVDSLGNEYFVNRINFTARHWQSGASGVIEANGIPHAHKFSRGNRIRIKLTNIDKTNRLMLGEYPFVVPMLAQSSVTIFADAAHPSYIELPLTGKPIAAEVVSSGVVPHSFSLSQNWPNPFNPITNYQFAIASSKGGSAYGGNLQLTILKVYDVLGREVATLVNEVKQPGEYTVRWDASNMPSGVYFCRLQAGAFTQTRKMILTR